MRASLLSTAILAVALTGCGGDKSDPCDALLTATFETVPNGPVPANLSIGGIRIAAASFGTAQVLRDGTTMPSTPAVFLANNGRIIAFADCDAHAVELSFDASDAPLIIELIAADTGGGGDDAGGSSPPAHLVESGSLTTTADPAASGYRRASITMPNNGKIRRVEIRGTGTGNVGSLLRLISFLP